MTRSCKGMLDLQLFGAGEVVHGTQAFVNVNAPANSQDYVATPGSESGLSAEMKTFYDKTLIELSGPSLGFFQIFEKSTNKHKWGQNHLFS